jgi:hypothetical protein
VAGERSLAITEAAVAAACPTRAVSNTAGVEANLAPDRRRRGRRLLAHFGDLPVTATIQRELVLVTALAKEFYTAEFYTAADEIMLEASVPDTYR